ncbi:Serine/threonine protein kinase, partial [Giardia duodenalis]
VKGEAGHRSPSCYSLLLCAGLLSPLVCPVWCIDGCSSPRASRGVDDPLDGMGFFHASSVMAQKTGMVGHWWLHCPRGQLCCSWWALVVERCVLFIGRGELPWSQDALPSERSTLGVTHTSPAVPAREFPMWSTKTLTPPRGSDDPSGRAGASYTEGGVHPPA